MASDDRERNFEKAMARELRADALNSLHCPDAETLAAYHERLLSPAEMAAQKSHIASCARCQEILSTLEVTESASNEAFDRENAAAAIAQKALGAVPTAPVFSKPRETGGEGGKIREMPKPKPYLRWVVPAGAIAAGLLVWVAINDNWNQRKAASKQTAVPVEVAENREQKEPQLASPKAEAAPAVAKSQGAVKADSDLKQAPEQEADKVMADRMEKSGAAASRAAANLPHGPRAMQNQTQNQIQNNANANSELYAYRQKQAANGPAITGGLSGGAAARSADEAKSEEQSLKAAAQPAAPPTPAPTASVSTESAKSRKDEAAIASQAVTVETPSEEKLATKEKKALDADVGRQQAGYVQNERNLQSLPIRARDAADLGETIVWTPDPKVLWLLMKDGRLRKSENGGKSSAVQNFGEGIKAIAASAPDAKTCWVLAQGNLVLRTMDGGKHWVQAAAPTGGEFRTIAAADSQRATVTDASGTMKLVTTDGGATWVKP